MFRARLLKWGGFIYKGVTGAKAKFMVGFTKDACHSIAYNNKIILIVRLKSIP